MMVRPRRMGCVFLAALAILAGCDGDSASTDDPQLVWGGPGRMDGFFHKPRAIVGTAGRLYVVATD